MGTFGWTMSGAPDPKAGDDVVSDREITPPRGSHFDPRNFSSLGPRVAVEVKHTRK